MVFRIRANKTVSDQSIETTCHYFGLNFGESLPNQSKKCCNIFSKHNKEKKKKAVGLITKTVKKAPAKRPNGQNSYTAPKQITSRYAQEEVVSSLL